MGSPQKSTGMLRVIGAFKLVKAAFLYLLAFGAFRASSQGTDGIGSTLRSWAHAFRIDPHAGYLDKLLAKIAGVTPTELKVLMAGTLIYALLFTVEGVGLLMEKVWAEWLTVFATASLMPLEVAMIVHHPSASHVATLIVNAIVVAYLVLRRVKSVAKAIEPAHPLSPELAALRRRQIRASQA